MSSHGRVCVDEKILREKHFLGSCLDNASFVFHIYARATFHFVLGRKNRLANLLTVPRCITLIAFYNANEPVQRTRPR